MEAEKACSIEVVEQKKTPEKTENKFKDNAVVDLKIAEQLENEDMVIIKNINASVLHDLVTVISSIIILIFQIISFIRSIHRACGYDDTRDSFCDGQYLQCNSRSCGCGGCGSF